MQTESVSISENEPSRHLLENWSSSLFQSSKKDDVVYFRMETPSQLEAEYEFGPLLGEGSFGVVYRGLRKRDNAKCAIKKIFRERTFSVSERTRLDREISILRYVKHPGIIELLAVAESPQILFLITELCEGDSLAQCVKDIPERGGFEEYIVAAIVKQVAAALAYLHNRGIVHRDLKAGNIMLLNKVHLDFRKKPTEARILDSGPDECTKPPPVTFKDETVVSDIHNKVPNAAVLTDKYLMQGAVRPNIPVAVNRLSKSKSIKSGVTTVTSTSHSSYYLENHSKKSSNSYLRPGRTFKTEVKDQVFETKYPPSGLRTKIIDFGLAIELRKNEEALASACGTPLYMAPEVLNGRSYTRQCDVWSLGILMFLLLTKETPFNAQTEDQLIEEVDNFNVKSVVQSLDFLSALGQECLIRLLTVDPAYRYSAAELLLDPWLSVFVSSRQDDQADTSELSNRSSLNSETDHMLRVSNSQSELGIPKIPLVSRPSSVRGNQSVSNYSTTNVLELMKQYHKELINGKQGSEEKPDNQRHF